MDGIISNPHIIWIAPPVHGSGDSVRPHRRFQLETEILSNFFKKKFDNSCKPLRSFQSSEEAYKFVWVSSG